MREFKGTKGKWFFEQDKEYPTLHNIWSDTEDKFLSNGTLIARTCYAPLSNENALLISKAPEYHEELLETITDLNILKNQIYLESKVRPHWEGMPELIQKWIDRKEQLIKQATEV